MNHAAPEHPSPTARAVRAGTAAAIAAAAATIALAHAQPQHQNTPPPADTPADTATENHWPGQRIEQRLRDLDQNDPLAYFTLAEDIAATGPPPRAEQLARELFVIAWDIDRSLGSPHALGRSAALALAELAPPDERQWLATLADALAADIPTDDPHAPAPWNAATPSTAAAAVTDDAPARLAEALSRLRAGEGLRMRNAIRPVPVEQTLQNAGLTPADTRWIQTQIDQLLETPRCPACNNARVVQRPRDPAEPATQAPYTLCPRNQGHPGPDLNTQQTMRLVHAEAKLLNATASTWAGQLAIDNAQPLRSLDPAAVAAAVGINPNARIYTFTPGQPYQGSWNAP